ncbi:hypothetical protein EVAR_68379_1 [Eumeta japonica]|uniref:Uncharacterized protein n=1 Tax=Eumeta variegata TaxID=151549 RepID=A0A4C1ZQK1_EUMVA|nr:hypothetical protein EVAR_68379_1 [Eumeta japonica]
MSHRTRERPAECLASLSHSTMIGNQIFNLSSHNGSVLTTNLCFEIVTRDGSGDGGAGADAMHCLFACAVHRSPANAARATSFLLAHINDHCVSDASSAFGAARAHDRRFYLTLCLDPTL